MTGVSHMSSNLRGAALLTTLALLAGCPSSSPTEPAGAEGGSTAATSKPTMSDAEVTSINNRGMGLMGQFNYPEAVRAFQQIVDARPELLDAHVNLMIATLNRQEEGDEARAIDMARNVVARDDENVRAHYCLGLLLYRAGELEQAAQHYQRAVEIDPGDAYALYSLGQCLEQEGKLDEAVEMYERTINLDPLLRSAYLRASQVNRRVGNEARADELLALFNRLETNPQSRVVEAKYTRMGSKAEVKPLFRAVAPPAALPDGPAFAQLEPLLGDGDDAMFRTFDFCERVSLTACDINGDGALDLFAANVLTPESQAHNAVIFGSANGSFSLDTNHPLAAIKDVRAALWGDFNHDGLVDVYLCRRGPNQLWIQAPAGVWTDSTTAFGVDGGNFDTVDGALIDADHDGDLDVLLINADGPNDLLNNNRDGTFRSIAEHSGIAGDGRPSRSWLASDLDNSRDLDLLVIKGESPHHALLNDRGWSYRTDDGFATLLASDIAAAAAVDVDADGQVEILTLTSSGSLGLWQRDQHGAWAIVQRTEESDAFGPTPAFLLVFDINGDGAFEAVHSTSNGWRAVQISPSDWGQEVSSFDSETPSHLTALASVAASDGRGASLVGVRSGAQPVIWKPGTGRHQFAGLTLRGGDDPGHSMRSNASAIGTRVSARLGDTWTVLHTIRPSSGPGQSLQPVLIGLAGRDVIDFVQFDWPDGVFQTELSLAGGTNHTIAETQRQISSCPVLFAWDGEQHRFISDVLGVGGMGYMVAPGTYAEPRSWERFRMPDGSLAPLNGRYVIKLGEPMEEACYLDALQLVAVDLPNGWNVAMDERMGISDPMPTGELLFYRTEREMLPVAARNDRHEDVLESLRHADFTAAPVGALDVRFLGRLAQEHAITLTFDQPIAHGAGRPVLLIDGWVEYPYSQTMFAAWQANAAYEAPTIEARRAGSEWQIVYPQVGYPAGMPRQMALPIDPAKLPSGATELRIRTNQEIYWDRIAIVYAEPCEDAKVISLPLVAAELRQVGYPKRTNGPQRLPIYEYSDRSPYYDMRRMKGLYTNVGPVEELVSAADGAMAIFGPGEEIHSEFDAASLPPLEHGSTRSFILDSIGWCKDMDLYTKNGETVGPLPQAPVTGLDVERLHRIYNTRYLSGH